LVRRRNKMTTKIGKWFYYSFTGKWYRFIDTRINEQLTTRVCQVSDTKPKKNKKNDKVSTP